ncbi:carbohydrate ABC transporter permease [Paenibacillus thalictri]|uniref:Carbohydrate ABC transporter permease n=1 Tax=Paenibacillus thalictri TaxID=2527873 RepID=A0A4Q9DXM6_9BACL|nr:carbohydrate ABC transporter permease [Paenibacillus thalictri]TBL81156.1 carbohydrate ABC transporter permease [Paenibacillus thalictri]
MRDTWGEKLFYGFNYAILTVAGLSCLLPLVHLISLSLSDSHAVASGIVSLWPVGWSIDSFKALFAGTNMKGAFQNSVILTLTGVVLSMVFTIAAAYPLSRHYFIGARFFTLMIVFTMMFGGGLIPTYLVVKALGLINTYGAVWFTGLVSVYNMLVMMSFFKNIPAELDEAAQMDGCGEWRYLVQIVLPLSVPVIAALSLFYGVGYWNAFFNVLIYINDTSKYNMAVLVQQMVQSQSLLAELNQSSSSDQIMLTPEAIKASGIITMVLPMLAVYPFVQKHFVKGIMLGAIKG